MGEGRLLAAEKKISILEDLVSTLKGDLKVKDGTNDILEESNKKLRGGIAGMRQLADRIRKEQEKKDEQIARLMRQMVEKEERDKAQTARMLDGQMWVLVKELEEQEV